MLEHGVREDEVKGAVRKRQAIIGRVDCVQARARTGKVHIGTHGREARLTIFRNHLAIPTPEVEDGRARRHPLAEVAKDAHVQADVARLCRQR